MVSHEDMKKVFEGELSLILDDRVRSFAGLCLDEASDYFFTDCPASSTGRYHPLDELSWDGTILHTRKVVTAAYELCRGLGCEHHRDEILSACIIHDLRKQGLTKTGHTTKDHPALAADLVKEVQDQTQMLSDESYNIIRNCCGFHYGLWSQKPWKKSLDEYTPEELCVYISDYVVSKRCMHVDTRR
jgi:hypothetical protein